MKKPTFENTVNILVQAYLNDTLEHVNCSACAVGNLVAHAMDTVPVLSNGEFYRYADGSEPKWQSVFCSLTPRNQVINPDNYNGLSKLQIDLTGYTWRQLARIEFAFERDVDRFDFLRQSAEKKDRQMFQGLMNVVDVLAKIHKVDLSQKEEAKKLFQKV